MTHHFDAISFCQSCGMPLPDAKLYGTNADGTQNHKYCAFCYADGDFTAEMTMEQMIDLNLQYLDEWNADRSEPVTTEEARKELQSFLPTLERWKS
jgi:hypothetical protein